MHALHTVSHLPRHIESRGRAEGNQPTGFQRTMPLNRAASCSSVQGSSWRLNRSMTSFDGVSSVIETSSVVFPAAVDTAREAGRPFFFGPMMPGRNARHLWLPHHLASSNKEMRLIPMQSKYTIVTCLQPYGKGAYAKPPWSLK